MSEVIGWNEHFKPFKIRDQSVLEQRYTTNPCMEISLSTEAEREQEYINSYMKAYFGGVSYGEVLDMVKNKYPEKFI